MRGMFWFGVGFAAGVAATRRASGVARRLTPAGAAENVNDAARELAEAIGSFGADVRAGMAEREAELHATVAAHSGIHTAPRRQVATRPGWTVPAVGGQHPAADRTRAGGS
ncbi:MAG: hypothetical protein GEU83_05715 [Pseudonocardiaceae bacterium]|nr:hypothetical protein [Pseudonocardiaceae bacterium]